MSSLEWALLERLVSADAWLRLAAPAALQPLATILLLAFIGGLMLAIVHATLRIMAVAIVVPRFIVRAEVLPRLAPGRVFLTVSAPSGGRGARAPGRAGRRSASCATAS